MHQTATGHGKLHIVLFLCSFSLKKISNSLTTGKHFTFGEFPSVSLSDILMIAT